MPSLDYQVPSSERVRILAADTSEPDKSLLLKLADEIDHNGGRVRVRFTRETEKAIDIDLGGHPKPATDGHLKTGHHR